MVFEKQTIHSILTTALFLLGNQLCHAQSAAAYVKQADSFYDAKEEEKAKALYSLAAAEGNADANFALAYKYVCTPQQSIQYYTEAARKGHADAMSHLFEALFFRSNSLTLTNPQQALDVYKQFKKQNPAGTFYDEADNVNLLKKAAEAGPFDVVAFISKYHITKEDTTDNYSIWQLAEQASRGERFGKPDPKLIFQLICHGGEVPAEMSSAVADAYEAWKENRVDTFNICDYVGSGYGLAFCGSRFSKEADKENSIIISQLTKTLKNSAGTYLPKAYAAAVEFINRKAGYEEGWGGSGYTLWVLTSADSQKAAFLDLVKSINKGYQPKLSETKDYDGELNAVYKEVLKFMGKTQQIDDFADNIEPENLRINQRAWIKYRDAVATLFEHISPSASGTQWQRYLTSVRTRQLKALLAK